MRILVRVDASRQIGTGHVMRCLTLANCLRSRGAEISFWTVPCDGDLRNFIEEEEFALLDPGSDVQCSWDWLVVDHYQLGEEFESTMRQFVERIFVIDDLANREHNCDLLLDQNMIANFENRYDGLVRKDCKRLLGPQYALLRPEFSEARQEVSRGSEIRKILVFFGGSDPTNETEKTLAAIRALDSHFVKFIVILGQSNSNARQIQTIAATMPGVQVVEHSSRISRLMVDCDLAVTAGGATTWERCCLGLPSIVIAVAENQEQFSAYLGENSYQVYLGASYNVSGEDIATSIGAALRNGRCMRGMGEKGMSLVDGLGTSRVADWIFQA